MYKLVAIDIDGTLLNSKKELTEPTRLALKKASDMGVIVLPCSGRSPSLLDDILEKFGFEVPIGAFNGALVLKGKEALYEKAMDKEDALRVYEEGIRQGATIVFWTTDGKLAFDKDDKFANQYVNLNPKKMDIVLLKDHMELFDEKIAKIIWMNTPEYVAELVPKGEEFVKGTNVICATSQPFLLEFTHTDANKSKAIESLCKTYNIDLKDTMAIGDGFNDIPMIEFAGLGVAMDNAADAVKKSADYITASNDDDGVKQVIDKFILGE